MIANALFRATAVDGGFSLTVPKIPDGTAPISGQSYIVLTGCNTTVSDDTVAAGPAVVEVRFLLMAILGRSWLTLKNKIMNLLA